MSDAILSALITGAVTLIGTVFTVLATSSKTQRKIEVQQAVTDTKIDELTRETRAHNNFAQRIPVLEEQVRAVSERVGNLEKK